MSIVRWKNGVPPAVWHGDIELTWRLLLWQPDPDASVARLMLVLGLGLGAELFNPIGFCQRAAPVLRTIDGHDASPAAEAIVPDHQVIGRWAVRVQPTDLDALAITRGVRLAWPMTEAVP